MKRIPFKPELARAIRDGVKTETRRLILPQPKNRPICANAYTVGADRSKDGNEWLDADCINPGIPMKGPRYLPGEIVGVAEPWCLPKFCDQLSGKEVLDELISKAVESITKGVHYMADGEPAEHMGRKRLARFLPDAFVRTRLEIVSVEAQQVQEITEEQAVAEGVDAISVSDVPRQASWSRRQDFSRLWNGLHPDHPWSSNPWVFRYAFTVKAPE